MARVSFQGSLDALLAAALAGTEWVDPRRIARDLRDVANMLEKRAGSIDNREPFTDEGKREEPQRD